MGVMRPRQARSIWVNTRTCPECGAKPGQRCFVLTNRTFRELRETHTEHSVLKDYYRERPAPPSAEELATRKKSTDVLDARYAEKKRREAEYRNRINGG